jgi:predicted N-acyltransferase
VFDHAWADAYERAGGRYYPKLVTAVPFTPVAGRRLLLDETAPDAANTAAHLIEGARALAQQLGASSWHCLFPTDAQLPLLEADELLLREGCQYHWYNPGYASFEDFLATLTSKRRKEIRRERREIADSGLSIELLEGREITPAHWAVFHRFYCDTFARKWGEPRLTLPFMRALSTDMPDAPLLLLARDGDDYVAGAFALRGGDTVYGRHWGCSRFVRHLHFELCYYRFIDYCIERGLRHFDAGAQGEHKVPRGFVPIRTWSVHWLRDPGFRRAVADFLRRETIAVDRYVESVAAHTAYHRGPAEDAGDAPGPGPAT